MMWHLTLTMPDTEFPLLPTPEPEASWPLLHANSLWASLSSHPLKQLSDLFPHEVPRPDPSLGLGVIPLVHHTHLLHSLQDLLSLSSTPGLTELPKDFRKKPQVS